MGGAWRGRRAVTTVRACPPTPEPGDAPDFPDSFRYPAIDLAGDLARQAALIAGATRHGREDLRLAAAVAPLAVRLEPREIALLRQLDAAGREADRRLAELSVAVRDIAEPAPDLAMLRALDVGQRRHAEWAQAARRRTAAFDVALVKLGWPPPAHIPATAADAVAEYFEAGELTAAELGEVLLGAHTPRILDDMLRTWAGHAWLGRRLPIVAESMACYRDGRFYATVCTLLPQIEGVFLDVLGTTPNPQNHAEKLFAGTYCSNAAQRYYVDVLNATKPRGAPGAPGSRHSILHGILTEFGTPGDALKVLLVLDRVIDAAAAYRRRNGVGG